MGATATVSRPRQVVSENTMMLSDRAIEIAERLGKNIGESKPVGDRHDRIEVQAPKYDYKDNQFRISYEKLEFIPTEEGIAVRARSSGNSALTVAYKGTRVLDVEISWSSSAPTDYEVIKEVNYGAWKRSLNSLYESMPKSAN